MTDEELLAALRESVRQVLEKMFFAEPLDGGSTALEADGLAVRVAFDGSPSGALVLAITDAAARRVAADFLGEDESSVDSAQTSEVICELANMICGSILSRVESQTIFRLASPTILSADHWRFHFEPGCGRVIHTVQLENGSLTASAEIQEKLCPTGEKSGY
ncbi:MAG TPA: chemotaxis protein CheX [Verrucomicrobiae bacterium]|nr:chemotaxis protein CheX [Verrucomicrobiae bacterium]